MEIRITSDHWAANPETIETNLESLTAEFRRIFADPAIDLERHGDEIRCGWEVVGYVIAE